MKNISYLKTPIDVSFNTLHLDPNNPRLAPEAPPGYGDLAKLIDPEVQKALRQQVDEKFDAAGLADAIVGQGWMEIDAVVVYQHPRDPLVNIVVEGNRRVTALHLVRTRLSEAEKRLADLKARKRVDADDLAEQEQKVKRLREVVSDTEQLTVTPVKANSDKTLAQILPRIMGVRHLAGMRPWEPHAQGVYVLDRYQQLYDEAHPRQKPRIDSDIVRQLAAEVSLGETQTRRMIQATYLFQRFKDNFTDQLPPGEKFADDEHGEFKETDFYLFQLIVKIPFVRAQLGMDELGLKMSPEGERALFNWVFKKPRPNRAEDNQNILYRHENLQIWDRMRKYDADHGTDFAQNFSVTDPDAARSMRQVEAEFLQHAAQRSTSDVIQRLIDEFLKIPRRKVRDEADFLRPMLEKLHAEVEGVLNEIAFRAGDRAAAGAGERGDDGDEKPSLATAANTMTTTKTARRKRR
jgi:hypothetical protein